MNDEFNYDNEIIEIGGNEDNQPEVVFEEDQKPSKKKKEKKDNIFKKFKDWFNNLDKKKKIIFIVSAVIVLILIIALILFLVLGNKDEKKDEKPVVLEADNYRYENGELVFLEDDKEIGKYECTDKDAKKCYVAYLDNEKDTFDHEENVDEKGNTIDRRSKIYLSKYVFVYDDEKIILYNIKDKKNEKTLKSIKSYATERDLVVVSDKDDKYGVIEFTEDNYDFVINAYYDYLGIIDTEKLLLVSKTDDKERIIDIKNTNLSNEFSIEIKAVNSKYIAAVSGKNYNLYTYKYEEVKSGYDYITFNGDYIALVKNNSLYFLDSDLNKMNEEGIVLTNDTYNRVNTYKDRKRISSEVAFAITDNENNLSIDYGDKENTVINKYEGAVSKNYNYINYFDGKLYVYSDIEKSDLIGTYNCKNKNKISSANDALSNCSVYANNYGVTGIYNNNYIFVSDNSSLSDTTNIILYSLKENKNKQTYTDIKFVSNEYQKNNIDVYYNDNLYVIAKSASKNNYGVIKLESNNVAQTVSANYKSIEVKGKYYLMQNADDKYSVWDNNFTKISDEHNHIDLLDRYYVGITDGKLNIYSYETTNTKVLERDLSISGTDYKLTIDNGFTIVIGKDTYKFNTSGKEIKEETPKPDDNTDNKPVTDNED